MGLHLTGSSGNFVANLGAATSDDTSRINAALTACRLAGGGTVKGKQGENYQISNRLVVGSKTTLDLSTCTLTLKSGSNSNIVATYSNLNPAATANDGAATAGSTTITTSLASVAVPGQSITIKGAGPSTVTIPPFVLDNVLTGIVDVVDTTAGTITLRKLNGQILNAGTSVTGAQVTLHNRDTDIKILIGKMDRGANEGVTFLDTHSLFMRRVDRLHIDIGSARSTGGKYTVSLADVRDFWVRALDLDVHSDGVHLTCVYSGHLEKVTGKTGDDFVAMTCNGYTAAADVTGDIESVTIGTISQRDVSLGHPLLIESESGGYIGDIKVLGQIHGSGAQPVHLGGYGNFDLGTYGDIDLGTIVRRRGAETPPSGSWSRGGLMLGTGTFKGRIKAHVIADPAIGDTSPWVRTYNHGTYPGTATYEDLDIRLDTGTEPQAGISLQDSTHTFKKVTVRGNSRQTAGYWFSHTAGTIEKLVFLDTNHAQGASTNLLVMQGVIGVVTFRGAKVTCPTATGAIANYLLTSTGADIKILTFDDCRFDFADVSSGYPLKLTVGTVGAVVFRGGYYNKARALVLTSVASADNYTVLLDAPRLDGCSRLVDASHTGTLLVDIVAPPVCTNMANGVVAIPFLLRGPSAFTLLGRRPIGTFPNTLIEVQSGAPTLRVNGADLYAAVSTLTPLDGDEVTNTELTGPGARKVIYNNNLSIGSKWLPKNGAILRGQATLVAGSATIASTAITATAIIETERVTTNGTPGFISVTRNAGVGFTINSSSNTDTSTIRYKVVSYS